MPWYYSVNGAKQGPVSEATLRSLFMQGAIDASTLVWKSGMADWQPLATALSDLASSTPPSLPSSVATPPNPMSAVVDDSSNPFHWFGVCIRKYATFSGRARRKEFWMFVLANVLIGFVLSLISGLCGLSNADGDSILVGLFNVFMWLPRISVSVRRLHDTNRSGWWLCSGIPLVLFIVVAALLAVDVGSPDTIVGVALGMGLLAIVLGITLFVFFCSSGTPGPNKYGPDPKRPY